MLGESEERDVLPLGLTLLPDEKRSRIPSAMSSLSRVSDPVPPVTITAVPVRPKDGSSSPVSVDRIRKLITGPTGLGTPDAWIPRQQPGRTAEPKPEREKVDNRLGE